VEVVVGGRVVDVAVDVVVATVDLTEGTGVELVDGDESSPPVQPLNTAATRTAAATRTYLAIVHPRGGRLNPSGHSEAALSRDQWPL
jgi:hypothetical protein